MKVTLKGQDLELSVTARSVMMLEKETGKTLQDVISGIADGKIPTMTVIASMIKQASKLSEEQVYDLLDENATVYMGIIKLYSEWTQKAFSAAEAGN